MELIFHCGRSSYGASSGDGDGCSSLGDMVLGFFEDEDSWAAAIVDEEDEEDSGSLAERMAFWETQHQLLKMALYRSTQLEARIRADAEAALRESQSAVTTCACRKSAASSGWYCRSCLLRDMAERLRSAGYDAAVCRSKWRSSPDIPTGEHTYVDVVDTGGKNPVRVVIEPDFRAEFEMARASQEYRRLIGRLPNLYVGKAERLKAVIKILCGAAKQCAKENKMHMAPWRRHKYVQAKWFGTCERADRLQCVLSAGTPEERKPKATISMLTFDLLERLPGLQCPAVAVV